MFNNEVFDPKKFYADTIKRHSMIVSRQFSSSAPSFALLPISVDYVEDEVDYINVG